MEERLRKPEGSTWTDDQWEAIVRRGQNLLVAAAAGSGKTAVLVERIIRRVADERDPVDVDRLLVATFTKAAAAEMRQRIRDALEKALSAEPESEHLRRQLALINRASITTLHSFCMEVIRRHIQSIRLDPGFRIANETEAELMRQDLLDELFEEQYGAAEDGGPFWQLVDRFSGERSDDALYRLVQRIYDESRSHPWPGHWLESMASLFAPTDPGLWMESLKKDVLLELHGAGSLIRQAIALAERPDGPGPYLGNLREDAHLIEHLTQMCGVSWEHMYHAFQGSGFGRLKTVKGDETDKELKEQAKELRNAAKDKIQKLKEELFGRPPEQFLAELQEMAPVIGTLVGLVNEFSVRYAKAKQEKGLLDFADLEHYCLQILCGDESKPGKLVPSAAALEYREQYVEVLLDEYQDTNRVQEAMIELISRPLPGNRFMVGDVKQSIYRFRLAEPGLFLEKYKAYGEQGADTGKRIDLARNFRSRSQVVDGVNFLFKQLMNERVGEIDYDERAELVCGAAFPPAGDRDNDPMKIELLLIDREKEEAAEAVEDDGSEEEQDQDQNDKREGAGQGDGSLNEEQEMETARLEARRIGLEIMRLMGQSAGQADGNADGTERSEAGHAAGAGAAGPDAAVTVEQVNAPASMVATAPTAPFQVFDKRTGGMRSVSYRDIVVLLRATSQWAPVFIEEFRLMGIPGYADLNTGYFTATEVEVMMSLLKIIDNPYQDIPFAAVLRSPIMGLSADDMAQIRIHGEGAAYCDAMRTFVEKYTAMAAEKTAGLSIQEEVSALSQILGITGLVGPSYRSLWSASSSAYPLILPFASSEAAAARETGIEETEEEQASREERERLTALAAKLGLFLSAMEAWRTEARQGCLSDLIWSIFRDTGFYDFVAGMPGGLQRQANLRALYDRAKQYEATSLRGLFRFLRFIERMKDSGGDLGTARALGEQEDVVRIMSIHKSKGLEFPVVFTAGLAKMFNQQDLNGSFLLHKELGFGPKFVDPELRISYPMLPTLAIRRRMRMEMLAEEMRILYVALTRAREKLYLTATVPSLGKQLRSWQKAMDGDSFALPDAQLAGARSYLDWVGPALIRHPDACPLRELGGYASSSTPAIMSDEPSRWVIRVIKAGDIVAISTQGTESPVQEERLEVLRTLQKADLPQEPWKKAIGERLDWSYPFASASKFFSKTTVSEMKRLEERVMNGIADEPVDADSVLVPLSEGASLQGPAKLTRRPRFMEQRKMNAAERGTVYHAVMQQLPLDRQLSLEEIGRVMDEMEQRLLLTKEQREAVDAGTIRRFFDSELGGVLLSGGKVHREVPFSCGLSAEEAYGAGAEGLEDVVLIQGVIDCLVEAPEGLVLIDYKTDAVYGDRLDLLKERYRVQLKLYSKAVEEIWKKPVVGKYLYFFDGGHVLSME